MDRPAQHEIAKRAYELWERGGRTHGHDQKDWLAAERELVGGATAAEDRPIGEIRSAEQLSAVQVKPAAPTVSLPPGQPSVAPAAVASPIAEVRSAPPPTEETKVAKPRAAAAKPSAGAGKSKASADLDAKLDELQSKLAAKTSKPRTKKPATNGAAEPKRSGP